MGIPPHIEFNGKSSWVNKIVTILLTVLITAGLMGLITYGRESERLDNIDAKVKAHIVVADAKIEELNALKTNQAVMAQRLESIDKTLKEINDEIKKRR